jgi:hypothetical protein
MIEVKLGATAWELILLIARRRNPTDQLSFLRYRPSGGTAERFPTCRPPRSFYSKTVDELLEIERGDAKSLATKLFGGHCPTADVIQPEPFSVERILGSNFRLPPCEPEETWAICSTVKQANSEMRLPLLDFRVEAQCPGTDRETRTLATLAAALKAIKAPSGALLNSGGSYHYYSFDPLSIEAWYRFMHQSLLLEPLVDVRYIAHRLESGRATLRISSLPPHKPQEPHVVGWISN